MKKNTRLYCKVYIPVVLLTTACCLCVLVAGAQNPAARYEIDAKRQELYASDKEALPRGREFVRLDSTYYVGWLYQGGYLFDRSADEAGFKKSIPYLRRAFDLLEKDFSPLLQTVYSQPNTYIAQYRLYIDYLELAAHLRECYEYLNMPDSAIWVIQNVEQKQFARDHVGLMFGTKSWMIYRNRYYTNKEYAFLKSSVEENVQYAMNTCYEGFAFIERNRPKMEQWFGQWQMEMDYQFIYHYLAMMHGYLQQYDSCEYYYNKMSEFGSISWNNYGSLKHEMGEFEAAEQLYNLDKYGLGGDKRLREPFYYLPTIYIYAGNTRMAMDVAKEAIAASQSYPGFGWYNIALARGYLYNGQLDSADATLAKAASFKEVHIGTTLTQPQYDFTINLLRQVWYQKSIAALKFADKGWWYKPAQWYKMISLRIKKYMHQYVLASQLADNPERQRIIYELFCGESTVTFDEIYALMETFGPRFFERMMAEKTTTDVRPNVRRYFALTEARLLVKRGKNKAAKEKLELLYNEPGYDKKNERLYRARIVEGLLALAAGNAEKLKLTSELLTQFPELIPFSEMPITLGLQITNEAPGDDMLQEVQRGLNTLNIDWRAPSAGEKYAQATVLLRKVNGKYEAQLQLKDATGNVLVKPEKFLFTAAEGVATEIGMRLMGKSGAVELEIQP